MSMKEQSTKAKQIPAFYLFETVETDGNKELKRIGAAFSHKKGNGFNFIVNGKRFTAFPPKPKSGEIQEGGAA